ncbi:ATP-binding protein [Dyadobacter frigoris]|uniref:histidine kinase n=1 Tax=Dyadobacter frigoris TaxID=2576211 RepID=A0A4U6CT89_9BACT|nr:ATP-binding protein [Dyadobacter frigoris]TKT87426.1 ATP-binding protein [Dyadobacter frigoris]GLU52324.1 hypothetical protein Dfri01_17850 [Dyadobacter frigoris]
MAKISFSVSARTAKLIGQENFANAEGAIIELVKNCYDADAKNCIIVFDNSDSFSSSIYIIDNGTGMTNEVIENQWMKIGTDDKLQNFKSGEGRVKTGAKGIGRFALDRLGLSSEMKTLPKSSVTGFLWSVTWSDFDRFGVSINEVEADLNEIEILDIKKELFKSFPNFIQLKCYIKSIEFSSGTILKINSVKDRWDEQSIKSLFDNLEVLIPPHEQPEFNLYLFSTNYPDDFGKVNSAYYDDYDYKIVTKYLADKNYTLDISVTRNELDIKQLETAYLEVFNNKLLKNFPYDLKTVQEKTFNIKRKIFDFPGFEKSVDLELIDKIGEFEFTFYFLKNRIDASDKDKFPYKNISQANRKAWLSKFGGVKIFRDDFRVRPYGEDGQDWLKLGERQARSPGGAGQKLGGFRIRPNQIAGTVRISRIANSNFQDKSGREGIQENEVFELFRNLLIEIISIFERDRNVLMFSLSELAKTQFNASLELKRAQLEAERILREQELSENTNKDLQTSSPSENLEKNFTTENTETEVLLAKATKIYEKELQDKNEEIKMLRALASVGLIISSFAHELKGLRSRLVPRTDFLTTELKKYIKAHDLLSVHNEDNPFYMLQLIKEEDIKLKHWLDYSLSTLKRDKRTRTNINMGEYFESFEINWRMALNQRKVKMTLIGSKDSNNIIQAFEVDLDAIFNNLLSNTLSAFKEKKGQYSREVTIEWRALEDYVEIKFSDNGNGLAKEYNSEPEKIFEFNESSKRDRLGNKIGTGMGLYIARLVIDDYNGAGVMLSPVQEGFCILVKFALRKNNLN